MITCKNISLSFGARELIKNATFTIGKKEKIGFVGRNGTGKSSLFRLLSKELEPDSGEIITPKQYKIGYLNQHITFDAPTIEKEAAKSVSENELYKVEAILFGLGFVADDLHKDPKKLSGGYALRLHLAKLLASEPDLLLLDEPTNYLDILSIRWLERFLSRWQKELVVISHDRVFLDHISTHTLGLNRQEITKVEGSTKEYYNLIAEKEAHHERSRQNLEKKKEHLQSFIDRFGAKNTKAKQAKSKQKAIDRLDSLDTLLSLHDLSFSFRPLETASKVILEAKDLFFSYTDSPLIQGLNFTLGRDDKVGIIGQNGKGKSTLLKLLYGSLTPTSGAITTISSLKIGYFGQTHIQALDPNATILAEIQKSDPTLSDQEARSVAGVMQFTNDDVQKKIAYLSGGEKSRVTLATIIAAGCHLLLLDEPTNHLDIESMEAFIEACEMFTGAIVVVSHSEYLLNRLAEKLIVFKNETPSYFLGDYALFLEKIGWDDEENKEIKVSQAKVSKRQRAEIVQERAKKLKPHKQKADSLESTIEKIEKELQYLNKKVLNDAENGIFSENDTRDLKVMHEKIDALFLELEKTDAAIQEINKSFSDLL